MLDKDKVYWQKNIKILALFSDWLDQYRIAGFKLGFWFAQQGSIYVFIVLIFVYVHLMEKLDKKISEGKRDEEF